MAHARLLLATTPGLLLDGAVAPLPLGERDGALLAWLALEGPTARTRIAALLWPGSPPEDARNSLRQRLFKLRRLVGADIVSGQSTLALAEGVGHDLDDADTVLADLGDAIGGEFAAWLEQQRARRLARTRQTLTELADLAEDVRDWGDALSHAQELLALEPLSEAAHRRVIRLHYLAGDRAAALLAFDRCERMLKDEVGARPDAETLALLQTVEAAAPPAAGRALARVAPGVLRPPRMVGRARELAALTAAVQGGLHVAVLGEAGMGKSRLLAEYAEAQGGRLAVAARPGDTDQPYAVFARLVRALLAAGRPVDATLRPELARFVPELGEPSRNRLEAAAFERVAEQLLAALPPGEAIAVDDLHFADAASVELFARLCTAPAVPPLLFGARPADGAEALATLERALGETHRFERVTLVLLGVAELVELVDSLAVEGLSGAVLAEPLRRHTGGNPQFVLETLRTLQLEGQALAFQQGALPVPAGVGALIERRLKRLSAPALKLARVAAIAAGDFSAPLAAAVLGGDVLDLADPWAELEAAQVLVDKAFAHDLVYEAVRAGVPKAIARPLHAGVAAALEAQRGAAASIAQHWLAAGELERAAPALEQAAQHAVAASRMREAADLYATLAGVHDRRGDAKARNHVGRLAFQCRAMVDEDGDWIDATLDGLEAQAVDAADLAGVFEQRARVAATRWDVEGGEQVARRAVELAQQAREPALESDSRVALAQILLKKRRPDEAAAVLAGAQEWIEHGAPLEQRFLYEQCMAWLALEQEHFAQAQRQWQRCAEIAVEQGSMSNLSIALGYQMLCQGYLGRFGKAAEMGERERALMLEYRLLGEPFQLVDLNLAHVYICAGRHADALTAIERAEAVPGVHQASLQQRRAAVYLALGQPGRARPYAQRALDEAQHESQRHGPLLALLRVQHALEPVPGMTPAQRALLDEADGVAALSPKRLARVRNRLVQAECSSGEERLAAAEAALALLAGGEMHALQIAAHARRGQALLECGQVDTAQEAVRKQLALSEVYGPEMMSPGEAGLIAARVLAAAGDPRAPRVLHAASDWLHTALAHQVPAEFRDSFLHRVPAHRELQALAAAQALEAPSAPRCLR